MSIKMKDLPSFERPRERLIRSGINSLSDSELLAIILKTGTKKYSVIELSQKILSKFKTIKNISKLTINELTKINGIKKAKACDILASIELGKRIYENKESKIYLKNLVDVYKLIKPEVNNLEFEIFFLICLDSKSKVLLIEKFSTNKSSSISLDLKQVFKIALKNNATNIIIIHNHPSGNSSPSMEDFEVTKEMIKISNLLEIKLIDHLIIGNNEYYSFLKSEKFYL